MAFEKPCRPGQKNTLVWPSEVTLHVQLRTSATVSNLPTLILLHFWGGSNATWEAFAAALDDRISLIIPSMRGWGRSSKKLGPGSYKAIDYANDIVSLIGNISIRRPNFVEHGIIIAGHSLGGKVALQLITDESIDKLLRGLILVAPSPASGFDFSDAMLERMRHAFVTHESACTIIRTAMLGLEAASDATLVSKLAKDATLGSNEAVVAFPDYGAQENFEASLIKAVKDRSGRGHILEALVLEGTERLENADTRVAAVLSDAGAHAKYERLDCGHLIPVERPQQLAKIVLRYTLALPTHSK